MKKFQFGLDNVLSYRNQVLEERQNEYAKALKQVQEQQAVVDNACLRYQQLNCRFREEASIGITVADAMGFENGLRVLEGEIARENKKLENLQREAESQRARVVQAHMDAAILERLKEKKRDAYRKEEEKQNERFIDELVSTERVVKSLSRT